MVVSKQWVPGSGCDSRKNGSPRNRRARAVLGCAALAALGAGLVAEAAGTQPTFAPATGSPFAVDGAEPRSVAVADVNGDGFPDLATANTSTNDISVLLGDGTGAFAPDPGGNSPFPSYGPDPSSVALRDVNGDGDPDLLCANYFGDSVAVLLNDGNGDFEHVSGSPFSVAAWGPSSLAVADVNGDGHPDLATSGEYFDRVSVLLGDGTGQFSESSSGPFNLDGEIPVSIVAADVNGDGHPDLATANAYTDDISVLLGDGLGDFALAPNSPFSTGDFGPVSVAAADLNGDGDQDLVTANYLSHSASVLLGDGTGNFSHSAGSPFFHGTYVPSAIAAADVNGDGKPDLVTTHIYGPSVSVLLGDGTGEFTPADASPFASGGAVPLGIAVADVTGDGKVDVLTANYFSYDVSVLLNTTIPDTTPPTGTPLAIGTVGASNGQIYVPVRLRDAGSGVKKVKLTPNSYNIHFEFPLGTPVSSPFTFPDPTPDVTIYAVKNTNAKARVELQIWDSANNTATVDPIVANLEIKNGRQLYRTFNKIPQAERYVRLQNGTPGLKGATLWINGRIVSKGTLSSGQAVDLDVVQWLKPGERNTATILATGPTGATAILSIGDVPTGGASTARPTAGLNLEFSR